MAEFPSHTGDSPQATPRSWLDTAVWIIPILFWALAFSFTWDYSSNVPCWDSWEFTELITGSRLLTLGALWEQHNEHRLVLQTLFEIAMGRYARWNIFAASFFPGILIGANSLILISATLRGRPYLGRVERGLLVAALSLVLFTFRQHVLFIYEIVMCWGILALAMTFFAWRFRAYASGGRGLGWLLVLLVIAALATGQGLALAVFVLIAGAVNFVGRWLEPRLPRSYVWLAAASAALLTVYFIGYEKPGHHPSVTIFVKHPIDALEYLAVLVGSPFAWTEAWAMWIGTAVLALFFAGLAMTIRRQGPAALWQVVVDRPLIPTNLIAMCAIMVGRVGFGPGQAVASHYVPFNAIFVVSALLLAFDQLKRPGTRMVVLGLLVSALIPTWYLGYHDAVREATVRRNGLAAYRDCVLANPALLAQCDGSVIVYWDPEILARRAGLLHDRGLAFFADAH